MPHGIQFPILCHTATHTHNRMHACMRACMHVLFQYVMALKTIETTTTTTTTATTARVGLNWNCGLDTRIVGQALCAMPLKSTPCKYLYVMYACHQDVMIVLTWVLYGVYEGVCPCCLGLYFALGRGLEILGKRLSVLNFLSQHIFGTTWIRRMWKLAIAFCGALVTCSASAVSVSL